MTKKTKEELTESLDPVENKELLKNLLMIESIGRCKALIDKMTKAFLAVNLSKEHLEVHRNRELIEASLEEALRIIITKLTQEEISDRVDANLTSTKDILSWTEQMTEKVVNRQKEVLDLAYLIYVGEKEGFGRGNLTTFLHNKVVSERILEEAHGKHGKPN